MSAKELCNGHDNDRPHEEMREIKELLKVLIESQAKQENIQNQILGVLRSISSAGNQHKVEDIGDNNGVDSQEITKASYEKQPSEVEEEVIRIGKYNPDRSDLLYEGDHQKTIEFLRNNPEALKQGVTHDSYTVLHVAIIKQNPRLLRIHDKNGLTPIQVALVNITNGQKEVIEYLYHVTKAADPDMLTDGRGSFFLRCLIEASLYDMALCLIKQIPELVLEISNNYDIERLSMSALEMMVRMPFSFRSGAKLTWWQDLIYSLIQVDMNSTYFQPVEPNRRQSECSISDEENPLAEVLPCTKAGESSKSSTYLRIYSLKQMFVELKKATNNTETTLIEFFDENPNIMKTAIRNGITEFVAECLEKFDYLIWPRISGET
ncbi:hypothetical protein MKX01_001687, partial [Papaver californicum]